MTTRKLLVGAAAIAVVAIGAAGAMSMLERPDVPGAAAPLVTPVVAAETAPITQPKVLPESRTQMQLSFAPVVKAVTPSVVNVYATTISQRATSPLIVSSGTFIPNLTNPLGRPRLPHSCRRAASGSRRHSSLKSEFSPA